ncbi:UNVERIFIED_CONTAM: hypothetical protein PYX00_002137 [Menopon gallinae]|uniref:Uncharacterized protein n=1 Tax=Menopon gallinae TaxID=328185 RepID=A0AAW2IF69_9NEOP
MTKTNNAQKESSHGAMIRSKFAADCRFPGIPTKMKRMQQTVANCSSDAGYPWKSSTSWDSSPYPSVSFTVAIAGD